MVRQRGKNVEITIKLTPRQIKESYRRLIEKQTGKDWFDDPDILKMLAKRESKVAQEIKKGQFITLKEFQANLGKE